MHTHPDTHTTMYKVPENVTTWVPFRCCLIIDFSSCIWSLYTVNSTQSSRSSSGAGVSSGHAWDVRNKKYAHMYKMLIIVQMCNSHRISRCSQCLCLNSPLQFEQKQTWQSLGSRTGAWDEFLHLSNTGEPLQKWCTSFYQQSLTLLPHSHPIICVNTIHRYKGRKKWNYYTIILSLRFYVTIFEVYNCSKSNCIIISICHSLFSQLFLHYTLQMWLKSLIWARNNSKSPLFESFPCIFEVVVFYVSKILLIDLEGRERRKWKREDR